MHFDENEEPKVTGDSTVIVNKKYFAQSYCCGSMEVALTKRTTLNFDISETSGKIRYQNVVIIRYCPFCGKEIITIG